MPAYSKNAKKWEKLKEAYRLHPGKHVFAAKHAGTTFQTAQRAWNSGNPYFDGGAPLREVIAAESGTARALDKALVKLGATTDGDIDAQTLREHVASEAIAQRAQLSDLIDGGLNALQTAHVDVGYMQRGMAPYMRRVGQALARADVDSPAQGIRILREYADSLHKMAMACKTLQEVVHTYHGAPSKIIGIVDGKSATSQAETMTADDMLREIESVAREVREYKALIAPTLDATDEPTEQ